jgi:cytochrome P450
LQTGKAIPHYAKMTHNELVKVLGVLDTLDARDESFNAYSLTLKIASQVIGKFTLMRDLHHLDSPESPLDDLVTDMVALLGYNKQVTSRGEWFGKLPFGPGKHLRDSSGHFHELLEKQLQLIKDDHEKNPRPDLDLETAAMDADCLADFFLRAADENGDKIPHDLMLANLGVLVGAGFTTTSSAMAWLLYALAKYPDCQDKMLQELVDNDITKDTEFTPAVLEKLTYLEKFLKETLRMHGPSFAPGRTAQVDNVVLPGGYVLNKGDVVISALYSIHYHPKIWNNPERFDPERWTPGFKPSRYEYMPFAAGGRSCIGFAFALQELRLFLATIVRYYDICQVGDEPIEYDPEFQLIRPTNLYIRAKRRPE